MARRLTTKNIDSSDTGAEALEATENDDTITETALQRTAEPEGGFSDAVREGAKDAREAVASFFPAVGNAIHKGVYNGFYFVTYGVVFGALTVGRLIPHNNAMGEGVHDGYLAAKKAFEESKGATATAAPMDEGLVPA
jgi:hypothetical protein